MSVTYTIKEFEALTNISSHNLRYFDKIDLLKPHRDSNGYRMYALPQVAIAEMITILQKDKRIQFIEQHDLNGFANMTCSLNEQFNMDQWNFLIIDSHDVNMICLCTDGISEDIQMSQRENFFRDLYDVYKLQTIRKIKCDIRKWLKNWGVKNHQDDKSIAILMKV